MRNEKVITIKAPRGRGTGGQKGPVRSSVPKRPLARRINNPLIRFYDLAQVNHEDLDQEPVWSDQPILKTPEYTTTHDEWGDGDIQFAGVIYHIESFENADYQNYTDLMFNYPVTEWKQRYRRIEGIPSYGDERATDDYRFDMRFTLRDSTISSLEELFMPNRLLSRSLLGAGFEAEKESYLTSWHHYWDNDRNYAGYRELDQLTGQISPRGEGGSFSVPGGYFGYSNDSEYFKVTEEYDFNADAVDPFEPSGQYDIFLMPQVGLFLATAHSVDWKTTEVLGLCYQVMPRHLWPRYLEPASTTGTGGNPGSDAAVSAWLEYQKGRDGVQASSWTFTGVEDTPFDFSYTEAPMDPASWTGLGKWGSAVNGGNAEPGGFYYSPQVRGREVSDNFTQYTTSWAPDDGGADPNFGNGIFRNTEPFLTAVIQKGGKFYYVWDISHAVEGFGNFSAFDTDDQNSRFKLYRGISWDSDYNAAGGLIVRDGTGTTFDW